MPDRIASGERRRRLLLATTLAVAMAAILALLISIVGLRRTAAAVFDESRSYQEVVTQTDLMMRALTDAETGQRGYALTQRPLYLEPFESSQIEARDAETALRAAIAAKKAAGIFDPDIERAADEFIARKNAALALISENVALMRAGETRRALAHASTDRGKDQMDAARAAADVLRTRAAAKASALSAAVTANRGRIDLAIAALIGVIVLAGALGGLILVREAAVLRRVGTDLARANADALAAKERAEAADAAKTRFLAMASHDMRQPLHALTLYMSSLKRRVDSPQGKDILVNMERAAESLTRMFSGLLDLARIEAGVLKPALRDHALAAIFEALEHELRNDAQRERIDLRILPTVLRIHTDPELMQSILRNLLTNAIKYAPEGRVLLGVRRRAGLARIEVLDEGPGIPEEKLVLMFGEFVRLERSSAAAKEGLGLGLSIASRLANLLDADLEVSSTIGKGTRFCVTAPIAEGVGARRGPAPAPSRDLAGLRIAILDDEPDSLDAMVRVVSDAGAEAEGFGYADRYVQSIRNGARFDLVIADPLLEAQAGAALGKASAAPTIIVTGSTDAGTLARLEKAGAPWLVKPVASEQLVERVARLAAAPANPA